MGAGSTITEHVCLVEGCYTFTINDSYGDGICCATGSGSYTVSNQVLGTIATGGGYAYSESTDFCVNLHVAVPDLTGEEHIDVRPLDGDGTYQLSLDDPAGPARLAVFDAVGRQLLTRPEVPAPLNQLLDLRGFASGVYLVRVELDGHVLTAHLFRP